LEKGEFWNTKPAKGRENREKVRVPQAALLLPAPFCARIGFAVRHIVRNVKAGGGSPFAVFVLFRGFHVPEVFCHMMKQKSSQRKRHQFESLSYKVIGACIDVQRQLGTHCMEVDYQRSLEIALPKLGVQFEREVEVPVVYEGVTVTKRRVDFVCWDESDRLLLETKAAQAIRPEDTEQSLLYVTKGNERLVLLVNFGERPLRSRRFVNTPTFRGEVD
jgi:GxxExxY protein